MFAADCRWKVIRMMIERGVKLYDAERTCCTGDQLVGGCDSVLFCGMV